MKPILLGAVAGAVPAIDVKMLAESMAANVIDCEPGRGNIRPLRARATVATVPASPQRKTLWRMGRDVVDPANYWLSSPNIVDFTLLFGTDTTERTAYTGDGSPRWTNNVIGLGGGPPYPQAYRELSVPAPSSAALLTLNADGTGTSANRYYVHTFVNDIGWESAPSLVSSAIFVKPGANITVGSLPAAPAGAYGISSRRIYRTQPETSAVNVADFYFLAEIAIGTTSVVDSGQALGGILPTADPRTVGTSWLVPPTDGFGIKALWNSMYAMLSGKQVMFSVAGAPYAWPLRQRKDLRDTPVGMGVWQQNLVVLTTGRPVVWQGADPASMQDTPMPNAYACVSARSIVSFQYGVVWASSEGLACTWQDRLLTEGILWPEQWKALVPSTMIAGRWGRFYVCAFNDATSRGFMFDPMNPADGVWYLSVGFDACHYDELADDLFVLEGANVRKFGAGPSKLTGTFTGKRFLQTEANNYGCAQVVASGYPVTLTVRANWTNAAGVLQTSVETRSVANSLPFKLKSGFRAEDWQPEVSGAFDVQAVRLARSMDDLKGF